MQNYCESCERNKESILEQLRSWLPETESQLLEVGSGSGQHALFFSQHLPHLRWQTTELAANIASLQDNLRNFGAHLDSPLVLDVAAIPETLAPSDHLFTANTLHIMSAGHVEQFMNGIPQLLKEGGRMLVYGPFRYAGAFTSASNEKFDQWLKKRDPKSGIRDIEWLQELGQTVGLQLLADIKMPANNQFLVWELATESD